MKLTMTGLLLVWLLLPPIVGCAESAAPSPPDSAAPLADAGAETATDVPEPPTPLHPVAQVVALRPLSASADRRIVDDWGREVLLRGVNLTSLGEYWQGHAADPPTLPTTDEDWDQMAARGVSVVRLVIHWSRLEPTRGRIDASYLDEIDAYVREAAARGIYTVIDMHQDAYSAFIFTGPDEECPEGTYPAKGWDGAPAWAVFTGGLSTCTPGERNASPAVTHAWNAFYDNHEGIRDQLVEAWAAVAARFAGRPEVAGFDLLNEPEVPRAAQEIQPLYEAFLEDTYRAIRQAQAGADFAHLLFVEPALPAADPERGLVIPDVRRMGTKISNVVSAPHNYAETIGLPGTSVTFETMTKLFLTFGELYGVPTWIGEYGFWNTNPETLEKLARYARDEDANRLGGAWWQWRQPCGDPHSLSWGRGEEPRTIVHLHTLECPGDVDGGATEPFMRVLSRGYPRATPGRLVRLVSDPETGALEVAAVAGAPSGAPLVVWTPTQADTHEVTTTGLGELVAHELPGGRLLTAVPLADGPYELRVVPRP